MSFEDAAGRSLVRLACWLFVLGALRLGPAAGDWLAFAAQTVRSRLPGGGLPPSWPWRNELRSILPHLWPVALAVVLLRRHWGQLARAAAITFAALALDRLAGIGIALVLGRGVPLPQRLSIPAIGSSSWSWAASLGLSGAVLVVAVWQAGSAWAVDRAGRRLGPLPAGHPRAVAGRMASLAAIVFAGFVLAEAAWDGYIGLLTASPNIRRLVLRSDPGRPDPTAPARRVAPRILRAYSLLGEANAALTGGDYLRAREHFDRAVARFETLVGEHPASAEYRSQLALGLNNFAWLLATCPDESLRAPARAVSLARRSVELVPDSGLTWNTLGVACYRTGNRNGARAGLERSMLLRSGGDSFDWFFMAMLEADEGEPESARRWFDRGVGWMEEFREADPELIAFRDEAAARLGIDPATLPARTSPSVRPEPLIRGPRRYRKPPPIAGD